MAEQFDAAKLSKRDRALSLGAVHACIFANSGDAPHHCWASAT